MRQENLSDADKDVVIAFTLVQKKQHSLPLLATNCMLHSYFRKMLFTEMLTFRDTNLISSAVAEISSVLHFW